MCNPAGTPDYTPVNNAANANMGLATTLSGLGDKATANTDQAVANANPIYAELVKQATQAATQAHQMTQSQWDEYSKVFQPAQTQMVNTAMNWDTPQREDQAAADAQNLQQQQSDIAKETAARSAAARGIDPSSGNALATAGLADVQNAATKAAAGNTARVNTRLQGQSLVAQAAGQAPSLVTGGATTSGLGLSQSQGAGSLLQGQQTLANSGYTTAANLYGGAVGANKTAGDLNLGQTQQQSNENASASSGLGALAGQLGAAAILSSKKLKDEVGNVDDDKSLAALRKIPVKAWKYKGGDGKTRIGPYAEDMQKSTGVGDGRTIDVASSLGLMHASIKGLAKKVDSMKKGAK